MADFGYLERVNIRDGWPSESSNFTPWLAEPENLTLLAKELGIELELVAKEASVGAYFCDIVAKRTGTEETVVVENQFGATDHKHLGQLMTYAAGVGADGGGAKTIVWIAETFNEPHRAALDWLNKSTEPGIRFFGVEIQLWRIGNSPFAPKFNVVSRPNDWQKQLSQETAGLSATQTLYQEFWADFLDLCQKESTTLKLSDTIPKVWWLTSYIGKTGFSVNLNAIRKSKKLECQLWIQYSRAKEAFNALLKKRDQIVAELGPGTKFDGMEDSAGTCKIFESIPADITDQEQWPTMQKWLKERGEAYMGVFTPLLQELKLD